MLIRKPVNLNSLTNEYQELVSYKDHGDFVEIELKYILTTSYSDRIKENRNWKLEYQPMQEYLKPGKTADWDLQMHLDLLSELRKVGIDPTLLSDKELVNKTTAWIFSNFSYDNFFIQYFVSFRSGKPNIIPEAVNVFNVVMAQSNVSNIQQAFDRGLSGREMFYRRTHGDCTSTAILVSTVLRALGIPTRIVLTVPAIDALDIVQKTNLTQILGITKDELNIQKGINNISDVAANFKNGAFVSHTFNEVYIGNEWVKLNYNNLGQGNVWEKMGLITQVNTFSDWADAYTVIESWGAKYAQEISAGKINNPYKSIIIEKLSK